MILEFLAVFEFKSGENIAEDEDFSSHVISAFPEGNAGTTNHQSMAGEYVSLIHGVRYGLQEAFQGESRHEVESSRELQSARGVESARGGDGLPRHTSFNSLRGLSGTISLCTGLSETSLTYLPVAGSYFLLAIAGIGSLPAALMEYVSTVIRVRGVSDKMSRGSLQPLLAELFDFVNDCCGGLSRMPVKNKATLPSSWGLSTFKRSPADRQTASGLLAVFARAQFFWEGLEGVTVVSNEGVVASSRDVADKDDIALLHYLFSCHRKDGTLVIEPLKRARFAANSTSAKESTQCLLIVDGMLIEIGSKKNLVQVFSLEGFAVMFWYSCGVGDNPTTVIPEASRVSEFIFKSLRPLLLRVAASSGSAGKSSKGSPLHVQSRTESSTEGRCWESTSDDSRSRKHSTSSFGGTQSLFGFLLRRDSPPRLEESGISSVVRRKDSVSPNETDAVSDEARAVSDLTLLHECSHLVHDMGLDEWGVKLKSEPWVFQASDSFGVSSCKVVGSAATQLWQAENALGKTSKF